MHTLYFVANPEHHCKTGKQRYRSHETLASATAEAIRLSKDNPGCEFFVMESKSIGKVIRGKLENINE